MSYQTNLTDARWQIIAKFIEDGRERKYSLRRIIDVVLYVVKTGCQWRYLPKDFPKWQLVYYYFRKFETTGLIEIILLFGFVFEIVNKVLGIGGFQVQPKRWIVERTFGWLIWNRRLVKDYEENTEVSRAFIQLAMIRIMLKQLVS